MAYTPQIGMKFWHDFDQNTKYDLNFMNLLSSAGAFTIQIDYFQTRKSGTYPASFQKKFEPHESLWIKIAGLQTKMIGDILGADWADIQAAFEDFGQGVLLDTDPVRQQAGDSIHTMDAQDDSPPVGYHRWHASIRAIQLLNIGNTQWWETLDKLVALGWAVQSLARPRQQPTPNTPLSSSDLRQLRDAWLALSPDARDRQYDLTGDSGYHPDPKLSGA
jgi:hypothetical protein